MVTGNIKFSSTRKISRIYGNLHVFSKLHGLHDTCIMYVRYHTLPFIFLSSFFVQYFFYYRNLIFKRNPLCQSFIHSLKSQDFCFVRKLLSCIVNDLKVPKRQHWKTVQAHGVCINLIMHQRCHIFQYDYSQMKLIFILKTITEWRVWHVIGDISYELKKKNHFSHWLKKRWKKTPGTGYRIHWV